jgi:hypothetical protein
VLWWKMTRMPGLVKDHGVKVGVGPWKNCHLCNPELRAWHACDVHLQWMIDRLNV